MKIYVRHYMVHALPFIKNLAAYPEMRNGLFKDVILHAIMSVPATDIAQLPALIAEAAKIGVRVTPGFRLMEPRVGQQWWLDEQRWLQNASYVRQICDILAVPKPSLTFDSELYKTDKTTPYPTRPSAEEFAVVFAPFAKSLRDCGVIPGIYPVFKQDVTNGASSNHIPTMTIEACGSRGEMWTETQFSLCDLMRLRPDGYAGNALDLALTREAVTDRYSDDVTVVCGVYDGLIRAWGTSALMNLEVFGGEAIWVFDQIRVDNFQFGTPDWYSGKTLSSTNDVNQSWTMGPYQAMHNFVGTIGGGVLGPFQALPKSGVARSDLLSSMGLMLTDGMCLRGLDVIPRPAIGSSNITESIEVVLPPRRPAPVAPESGTVIETRSSCLPILSASQLNSQTWQLVYDEVLDQVLLELLQGSGTKLRTLVMNSPPKMVPLRFVVSLAGTQWSAQGADQVNGVWTPRTLISFTPTLAISAGAGHLYVGGGVDLGTRNPATGRPYQLTYEGLIFCRLEQHLRALTSVELLNVLKFPFPRLK